MKYVSEEELRKWLITDGCAEGHGYIDEDDFVCLDWEDDPIKQDKNEVGYVLDKIKAEIEEYKSRQLTLAIGVDDLEKGKQIALEYVLAILDKYKKEGEE